MTRADRILLVLVVGAMPFLYFHIWFSDGTAKFLLISSDDDAEVTELLTPDRLLRITGPLGESVVEVKDGRTRFLSSPCLNQVCVHSGWLSGAVSITACLPNRISLTLVGQHPRFDAINF